MGSGADMPHLLADTNGLSRLHPSQDGLIYRDGCLVSGSLEALIHHLVPNTHYYPDRSYIFAFLLSSRLFIPPPDLMARVWKLCLVELNVGDERVKEPLGKLGCYILQLLSDWTEMFAYDFRDEQMMQHLKEVTQKIVRAYPELRKDVGVLMHNLITKLSNLEKYEELLLKINEELHQRLLNLMPTTDIYEICPNPLVLAQQLTHIELERLSMIGPEEFVENFIKEKHRGKSTKQQCKNLDAYIQWFNRLSYFVATEICMHLKKKHRMRMMEYFIDVAKECMNIGNFNSLMAIISGLNMAPVQRLKRTWSKLKHTCNENQEKFEVLEHQMDPSANFGNYRSCLKAALWRFQGAVEDREKIVIPFISLYMKDMYFLNEGCADMTSTGQVNFEKIWLLAKQVTEFITWKQVECPFDRQPPILNYLLTNPVFSENSLTLASFECEAPDNSYEKDKYKQLREQAGLS